jgi:hypothetical protein
MQASRGSGFCSHDFGVLSASIQFGMEVLTHRSAKFLTEEERTEVERRLKHDRSSLADEFNLKFAKDALTDWKIYVHMFITIGIYTPLYSISLFLPT